MEIKQWCVLVKKARGKASASWSTCEESTGKREVVTSASDLAAPVQTRSNGKGLLLLQLVLRRHNRLQNNHTCDTHTPVTSPATDLRHRGTAREARVMCEFQYLPATAVSTRPRCPPQRQRRHHHLLRQSDGISMQQGGDNRVAHSQGTGARSDAVGGREP